MLHIRDALLIRTPRFSTTRIVPGQRALCAANAKESVDVEDRTLWRGAVPEMEVCWSSGVVLQGEASNHRKLRRSRAGVVSVAEKARLAARQE
jgi:hypothetical protein